MSTVYDFTYTLNSETTQTELLNNAISATAKVEYAPTSHFFVDETKLASIVSTNYATDAFGPVTGSETIKYRTTSVVRVTGTAPVKVFAICAGQVLIQPQSGDATKVNLIVKPSASYSPLKIKYFIYRGVNKADLISSNILQPIVNEGVNQPFFLRKLWKQYKDFYAGLIDPSTGEPFPAPNEFPGFLIGYDENQSEDILIENYFTRKEIDISYQIPLCSEGEHLGNFTGEIGLDIVLDFGDYQLQNQEELFKFDLKFARKKENIFNTLTIPSSTAVKVKRYKEYIHQFMDAAAFWGSHIECGTIVLTDASKIKTNDAIFTKIVNKYQTQNKIYVYIQGENNRSYNYYDATRKVYGFNTTGQLNDTFGWPIIIDELTVTVSNPPKYKKGVTFNLEYNIDTRIPEPERHIALEVISPNNITSKYPLLERPLNPLAPLSVPAFLINKTVSITTNFQINGTKSCAGFLMLYGNLKQEFPLKNYYNDLFPVNFNTNFQLPTTGTENMSSWATYDKSRMVNLDDVLDVGASIQNKVVFDIGKGPLVSGVAPRKPRRLYMAILKRNSIHNTEYDNFNIDSITAGINKSTTTQEQYALNVYNNSDFSVYKGTFIDNGTLVDSLALVNENSLVKKNSFFHLGITEEEYNKLIYAQTTVPVVTPPPATVTQFLPVDADNVFFHLEEVVNFPHQNVQKFKVGFRFEDNTGSITTLFPATANEVFVYTLDGFYFFSKEYSEFQEFYNEFALAKVEFRTVPVAIPASGANPAVPAYNGEFGFDWLRIGDNGEPSYESTIVGGYERPTVTDTNTEYEYSGPSSGVFNDAAKALKREYKSIPTQAVDEQYFVPYLNLFSKTYSNTINTSPAPPFKAILRVLVDIGTTVGKLEFDYDKSLFTIDKPILSDKNGTNGKVESIDKTIEITCLKDFSETQQIKILAYPVGVVDKKQAKLAGIIIVGKNDGATRKVANIVLVSVHTDVNNDGTFEIAQFMPDEVLNLRNILYQNLTNANIKNATLDLTNGTLYPQFKQQFDTSGNKITKGFIHSDGGINIQFNYANNGQKIHHFLKNEFIVKAANSQYNNYCMIFAIDNTLTYDKTDSLGNFIGYSTSTLGHVDDIGIPLVVVYNPLGNTSTPRDLTTLNHEIMHGYGLYHTHRDGVIIEPQIEFVYPHAFDPPLTNPLDATDNVMSYNSNAITLWRWQQRFINLK